MKGDFKKRINKQKEEDKKRHERTYMVKNIEVIVDINTCKVNTNELGLIINDLLNTTKNEVYQKNKIFHLNIVCDFSYDLEFLGVSKDKKLYFKLI